MSLTDRQARAVRARGGVAITAGAGTGKTHTLGHRYLAHLEEGLSPLRIVAVTFTERAARGLRARVRAYARARLGEGDARLAELEAATIGTVHALCLRICRDHPDAAGVPPGVRILDPLEGAAWRAERLERALGQVPEALFDALPYERVRDALAALLDDPWRTERALAHGPEAWPELVRRTREAARAAHLDPPSVQEAVAALRGMAGPEGDRGEDLRRSVLAAVARAGEASPDDVLAPLRGRSSRAGTRRAWGEALDELRAALGVALEGLRAWRDDPRAHLSLGSADDTLAALLPPLRQGYERVRAALQEAKRRRRVVDFADVETAAARALRRPEVRAHYAARFSALLVDEVQDTSPLQAEILEALSGFCRTTVVGDAKQSIYAFRGADASVFHRMTDTVARDGGEAVTLDLSFRTHEALVERGNRTFEALLGDAHEPLRAQRSDAPHRGPHLRWLSFEGAEGAPAGLRRLAEAHRIADEILALSEAGTPVHDEGAPGGQRPIRPGDVAVLARTWAPLDLLAEVLPARGVPAVHTGGGDLLQTREAQDGEAALRFLADAEDDVALLALLRGPCFAVSDAVLEALAMRQAPEAPTPWWTMLRRDRPEELAGALAVLERLRDAATHEAPSRLLRRLDRETGWSAVVANLPSGPRRSADLDGFLSLVRDLEAGNGDVFTVARRLRRLRTAGAQAERPALDADDAVTLTTIHRSKGLEWPCVIIAALDVKPRGVTPAVRTHPDWGVALRVEDAGDARAEPALWTCLEAAAKEDEQAEDRRLLYVALTRAGDQAVVSAAGTQGAYLDLLRPGLVAAGVEPESAPFDVNAVTWPSPPVPSPAAAPEDDALARANGGSGAGEGEVDGRVDAAARQDDPWEVARLVVDGLAPELGDAVEALARAGVPAPDRDGFARRMAGSRRGQEAWTLLRWSLPAGRVVLMEPGATAPAGTEHADEAGDEEPARTFVVIADPAAPGRTAAAVAEAVIACRG